MLIIAIFVLLLLVAFPTTTFGRTLRAFLVEAPPRRLNSITTGQIAFYCALGIAGFVLFALFETEGVRLFTLMAPDLIVWFTVFDVSLFLDVIILGITLTATTRFRPVVERVVHWAHQVRSRVVGTSFGYERGKRRTPRSDVASDDPDPFGFRFAPA